MSLMRLLSGEAAAQLCKQCTITAFSSSFVGMGRCHVNTVCDMNTVLVVAYQSMHKVCVCGGGAFPPQAGASVQ